MKIWVQSSFTFLFFAPVYICTSSSCDPSACFLTVTCTVLFLQSLLHLDAERQYLAAYLYVINI